MTTAKTEQQIAIRVTLIGSVIDAILGVSKIIVGIFSHSAALVADGIHSLSDLVTDGLVIVILRVSRQEPDEDHPWGHGRFETVGTVVLGCILVAVAGAMAYESIAHLVSGDGIVTPEWPALVIAAISIVAKEWIYRYSLKIGQQLKSDLLIANAWHSRTDALSSIVVLVGVAGAMMGVWWLDSVAAFAVAIFVAKIGWDMTWNSIKELVDTALPEERVQELKDALMESEGIIDVHSFKTRNMAGQGLLEMHIQVRPYISASEGHYIGESAVARLQDKFDDIGHIIFHIDTYNDDEEEAFSMKLPMRSVIEKSLRSHLNTIAPDIQNWERLTLYYRDKVEIDMFLDQMFTDEQSTQLQTALQQALNNPPWLRRINVWSAQRSRS